MQLIPLLELFTVVCILFRKNTKMLFSNGANNGSAAEVHGKGVTKRGCGGMREQDQFSFII
jgi:hypothetical protein